MVAKFLICALTSLKNLTLVSLFHQLQVLSHHYTPSCHLGFVLFLSLGLCT